MGKGSILWATRLQGIWWTFNGSKKIPTAALKIPQIFVFCITCLRDSPSFVCNPYALRQVLITTNWRITKSRVLQNIIALPLFATLMPKGRFGSLQIKGLPNRGYHKISSNLMVSDLMRPLLTFAQAPKRDLQKGKGDLRDLWQQRSNLYQLAWISKCFLRSRACSTLCWSRYFYGSSPTKRPLTNILASNASLDGWCIDGIFFSVPVVSLPRWVAGWPFQSVIQKHCGNPFWATIEVRESKVGWMDKVIS